MPADFLYCVSCLWRSAGEQASPSHVVVEAVQPILSLEIPYGAAWIIRNGAIVNEAEGFGGDGDKWVERLEAEEAK